LQGLQTQFFSLFILFSVFAIHIQLIIARFVEIRTLYEARERPSRTFPWRIFVMSNIIAEIPNQTLMAVLTFLPWYYPLGWHQNAAETGSLHARGGLTFLFVWSFMLWTSTFAQMIASFTPDTATGIAIANVFYILSLLFSG
jgi:ABC-type multidrug transport system permease subunit